MTEKAMKVFMKNDFGTIDVKIFKLVKKNPYIKYEELAKIVKLNRATVSRYLARLKDRGYIAREGTNFIGNWVILKELEEEKIKEIKQKEKNSDLDVQILKVIAEQPDISYVMIGKKVNRTKGSIFLHVTKMVEEGILVRCGNIKKGYWKIEKETNKKFDRERNRKNTIVSMMEENPYIPTKKIAEEMNVSISTVTTSIKELINDGIVIRKGTKQNVFWKLKKNLDEIECGSYNKGIEKTKIAKKILKEIRQDNTLRIIDIANKIEVPRPTVCNYIKDLKEANILLRIGTTNSGHWEIVKQEKLKNPIPKKKSEMKKKKKKVTKKVTKKAKKKVTKKD